MSRVIHSLWPWTPVSGCAATAAPDAPFDLSASGVTSSTITLEFDDSTSSPNEATSYEIGISSDGGSTWTTTTLNVTGSPPVAYQFTGLSSGTTYDFRVRGVNCAGAGSYDGESFQATTSAGSANAVPSVTSGLTATAASTTQIDLAWNIDATASPNQATYYEIESSTDNVLFSPLTTVNNPGTGSYSATGLSPSTQYWFRMSSCNTFGCSAKTASATATTQSGSSTYNVEYLVVAGGGGGGTSGGGGGGAGGYRTATGFSLTPGTSYTITVGAGGAAGANGSNSVFDTITSTGGGRGGNVTVAGSSGGSGGGGGQQFGGARLGGAGTSGEGNAGGRNSTGGGSGGGGGGASGAGGNGQSSPEVGGAGGAGTASSITGTSVTRAGGGGGGTWTITDTGGTGGSGGGGNGASGSNAASSGTVNSGSGGGASGSGGTAGSGGSGVVILRMPTANYSGTTTGSPTVTTSGSDTILEYTASGTYTA